MRKHIESYSFNKKFEKISAVPQKSVEKVHKPLKKWMYKTRFYLHIVKGIKKLENGSKNRFLTGYVIEGKANR